MADKRQIPVAEGLFVWPSTEPGLIVSRCRSCGTCYFPKTFACHNPDCTREDVEEIVLSGQGKLWTYTILHYVPPFPFVPQEPFSPIYIGLVEFPEGIRILGQLTGTKDREIKLNMDVKLVIEKLHDDQEGNEVVTWKFKVL